MSPKGEEGEEGDGSGGTVEGKVMVFTFLRYRRIRDGVWGSRCKHAKGEVDSSYINAAWVPPTKGRGCNGRMGDGDKTTFAHAHKPAVINLLKRADAQG